MIVHGSNHCSGTHWLTNVLRQISDEFELNFKVNEYDENTDIFLEEHSNFNFDTLPPYVGSHIIRDPRDMIVSGYFYHLISDEPWLFEPNKKYGGLTYQEHIRSIKKDEGILAEIERSSYGIRYMSNWDYSNPKIMEVRYEYLVKNEQEGFRKIFEHYGFNEFVIEKSLEIVKKCRIDNPGIPGEWKKHFNKEHKQYFIELLGDCLIKLRYETNNDW